VLFRLTSVLIVLVLLPAGSAIADPGASPSGDAAQSQYGGTPPQPVPQPGSEGDVQAEDEVEPIQDETDAAEEEGAGEDAPGQAEGTDEETAGGAPGASGGSGGSGGSPQEAAAEVRDVASGAGQGGALPFTGSATLLALGAGALLVVAGLATRRIGSTL
jgi:hypothetical protein